MNQDPDTRLWASRASFGLAALALTSLVHGGCQRLDGDDTRTTTRSEPAVKPVPNETRPAILKPVEPTQPVAQAEAPKGPPPEAVTPSKGSQTEQTPEPEDLEGTLTVKRLSVTTEVKDREPVAASTFVAGGDAITAFVEMANTAPVDQKIVVTFENADEKKFGFVELVVPKQQKRWRTWGQTRQIKTAGEWTAVVSTETGVELSRHAFEVEEAVLPSG